MRLEVVYGGDDREGGLTGNPGEVYVVGQQDGRGLSYKVV